MTDEASAFFQDIKGQDNKNESNIGLMNQLFDGRGDKTSLAQLRQRYVPINSTSMCLGVQPQPFFKALTSIDKTVWMDSGFAERFLFMTVRPFRYFYCNTLPKYSAEIIAGNIHLRNTFPKYSRKVILRNIPQKYSLSIL